MSKLLYINANPKEEKNSFSMQLGRTFLNEIKQNYDEMEIVEIDLYKANIPAIDADVLNGWEKMSKDKQLTNAEIAKIGQMSMLLEEFISTKRYVLVTPMWNFLFPPVLKAYIDCLVMAGKTFSYEEHEAHGLLKDRKILHIQATGGLYDHTDHEKLNYADNYLRDIFSLIGIDDFSHIGVEDTHNIKDAKTNLIKAKNKLLEVVKRFG